MKVAREAGAEASPGPPKGGKHPDVERLGVEPGRSGFPSPLLVPARVARARTETQKKQKP